MNPWFILILPAIFILVWILFFSHVFVHVILKDETKRASFTWLGCGFYLDWSAQKISFYLFNLKILSSSLRKKRMQVIKAGKTGKVNYIILWQKKDTIIKTLKIALRSFVDMLRKTKLKRFSLSLRVATPDLALTGMLYAGLLSISFPLRFLVPKQSFHFYPDFVSATPKANLEMSLRLRTMDAFWIAVRTFFLLPKISLFEMVRKLNKKRR